MSCKTLQAQTSISIRTALAPDRDVILACLRRAFAPYETDYTPAAYQDTVLTTEGVAQRMQQMQVLVAIFEPEAKIVGTLAFSLLNNGEGHLRGMAVLPEWQGREISKRLLSVAEERLRRLNCTRITLDTTAPLRRAMSFYERHGYLATGKQIDFFGMLLFEHEKSLNVPPKSTSTSQLP